MSQRESPVLAGHLHRPQNQPTAPKSAMLMKSLRDALWPAARAHGGTGLPPLEQHRVQDDVDDAVALSIDGGPLDHRTQALAEAREGDVGVFWWPPPLRRPASR